MKNIEKESAIPRYYQLAQILISKVKKMKPGSRLPSVQQLKREYDLSQATVDKAFALLDEQGYIATEKGRGTFVSNDALKLLKYKNLGLIMPSLGLDLTLSQSPANYQIFDGIQKYCQENFWDIQIIQRKNEDFSWEKLEQSRLAGLIIVMPNQTTYDLIADLKKHHVPFLCINLHPEKINHDVNYVNMDFYNTTIDAVKYLYEKGRRSIGIVGTYKICEDSRIFPVIKGYRDVIKALNLNETVINESLSLDLVSDFLRKNMQKIKKCDAVITAVAPEEATALLDILKEEKIKVPEEISLVSFHENEKSIKAGITSYSPAFKDIGYKSASLLNEILNDENKKIKQLKIKLDLFERTSV